jgi:hypothetical protein
VEVNEWVSNGIRGQKPASMRIFDLGVFALQKLHLKHINTALRGGKERK